MALAMSNTPTVQAASTASPGTHQATLRRARAGRQPQPGTPLPCPHFHYAAPNADLTDMMKVDHLLRHLQPREQRLLSSVHLVGHRRDLHPGELRALQPMLAGYAHRNPELRRRDLRRLPRLSLRHLPAVLVRPAVEAQQRHRDDGQPLQLLQRTRSELQPGHQRYLPDRQH
jgi:hypothetical protein